LTRRSTYRSTKRVSRAVGLAVLLKASPARADVLVPATFVVYGYLFELHLAPAILLVETIIARRVLGLSWARSLLVAGAANAASTAAGLLLVLPMTIWMSVRGSLEAGAFLVLMLCLPLCAASIWMEGRVAARLLRRTHPGAVRAVGPCGEHGELRDDRGDLCRSHRRVLVVPEAGMDLARPHRAVTAGPAAAGGVPSRQNRNV
jgi:hypothetical protein